MWKNRTCVDERSVEADIGSYLDCYLACKKGPG